MRPGFLHQLLTFTAGAAFAAAAAMSHPVHGAAASCKVIGAATLPPGAGGEEALCRAVEQAVADAAPGLRYSAEVRVASPSKLSATITVDGRALPEQTFAVMDRTLNPASIHRFAQALAAAIASAGNTSHE
jgi:hypothetical protein